MGWRWTEGEPDVGRVWAGNWLGWAGGGQPNQFDPGGGIELSVSPVSLLSLLFLKTTVRIAELPICVL